MPIFSHSFPLMVIIGIAIVSVTIAHPAGNFFFSPSISELNQQPITSFTDPFSSDRHIQSKTNVQVSGGFAFPIGPGGTGSFQSVLIPTYTSISYLLPTWQETAAGVSLEVSPDGTQWLPAQNGQPVQNYPTDKDFHYRVAFSSYTQLDWIKFQWSTVPPVCGDGKIDAGEECDDGNTNADDQCNACKKTYCGDNIQQDPNGDGQSEECDGSDDSLCPNLCLPGCTCSGGGGSCEDKDSDGFSTCFNDCNDNNPSINPDVLETCGDSIDQNCDGQDESCGSDTGFYAKVKEKDNLARTNMPFQVSIPFKHGIYTASDVSKMKFRNSQGKYLPTQAEVIATWPFDGTVMVASLRSEVDINPNEELSFDVVKGSTNMFKLFTHPDLQEGLIGLRVTSKVKDLLGGEYTAVLDFLPPTVRIVESGSQQIILQRVLNNRPSNSQAKLSSMFTTDCYLTINFRTVPEAEMRCSVGNTYGSNNPIGYVTYHSIDIQITSSKPFSMIRKYDTQTYPSYLFPTTFEKITDYVHSIHLMPYDAEQRLTGKKNNYMGWGQSVQTGDFALNFDLSQRRDRFSSLQTFPYIKSSQANPWTIIAPFYTNTIFSSEQDAKNALNAILTDSTRIRQWDRSADPTKYTPTTGSPRNDHYNSNFLRYIDTLGVREYRTLGELFADVQLYRRYHLRDEQTYEFLSSSHPNAWLGYGVPGWVDAGLGLTDTLGYMNGDSGTDGKNGPYKDYKYDENGQYILDAYKDGSTYVPDHGWIGYDGQHYTVSEIFLTYLLSGDPKILREINDISQTSSTLWNYYLEKNSQVNTREFGWTLLGQLYHHIVAPDAYIKGKMDTIINLVDAKRNKGQQEPQFDWAPQIGYYYHIATYPYCKEKQNTYYDQTWQIGIIDTTLQEYVYFMRTDPSATTVKNMADGYATGLNTYGSNDQGFLKHISVITPALCYEYPAGTWKCPCDVSQGYSYSCDTSGVQPYKCVPNEPVDNPEASISGTNHWTWGGISFAYSMSSRPDLLPRIQQGWNYWQSEAPKYKPGGDQSLNQYREGIGPYCLSSQKNDFGFNPCKMSEWP